MKDWQKHLVTFLIGAGAAMCLCLTCNPRVGGKDALVQSDTIVKYETLHYSRLELAKNTIKLDVPKISARDYVCVRSDSTTIIYKDSVRYVTLPRENYYTKVGDAEIWHSGISSRIDSLNIFKKDVVVTDTYKRQIKNEVYAYGSVGYVDKFRMPIGVGYMRHPKNWIGFGVRIEHDVVSNRTGAYADLRLRISW